MEHLKEIKKQIKFIYKTFETDSKYEWMVNTENKIKNEKKTLESLRNENKGLIRVYEKSMAAFKKTETEKNKKREAVDLKSEI